MGFLTGKRALVVGVASNRSIAYGIAAALHREGAELAFTYQNERMRDRVEKLVADFDSDILIPCNVESDEEIEQVFEHLDDYWDGVDILVHSVAYAPKEELDGDFLDNMTRDGFRTAHDVSSYSLAAFAKAGRAMMKDRDASILTLSYLGAQRSMPNYNVMGLAKASLEANVRYLAYTLGPEGTRVNAVSAGPIRTLAASGIGDFKRILDHVESNAPLRRNVTIDQVGNAGAFLCSDLASGITGEVMYVDSGYNTVGLGQHEIGLDS
ncbi:MULTISPECIES: enoyl-ACP reductase FabI [Thioalkalivibrio]|uniref:Enoyl-[acyl-carrier-protein] reductase [NADH] n=1 Tax=Thioalkalivibrio halophilus TaxID=252474 RepID=A0A1V3A0S8_9GAMM|nr:MULTISPECIES: enoyl-ACP reductase [Thioalkalivibrio]OOC10988.1 enoyl-ACP reductase [Thioalkalivibrio halophilus]PYG02612.1 enoyl-[acyl-carrier-protein] reductase [NADH] [Thioalkalivibrio sp. ALE21]